MSYCLTGLRSPQSFPAILRRHPYLSLQPYLMHPGLHINGDWGSSTLVPYLSDMRKIEARCIKGRRTPQIPHNVVLSSFEIARREPGKRFFNLLHHPSLPPSLPASPSHHQTQTQPGTRLTSAPAAFAIPAPRPNNSSALARQAQILPEACRRARTYESKRCSWSCTTSLAGSQVRSAVRFLP